MWLRNIFFKTKNKEGEDIVQHSINEESVSSNNEEKPTITADLQKGVEHVNIIPTNFQDKQDLNLNNNTTNTKTNSEINNCKIEDVLKIIPVIEKNIQTLTEKVNINELVYKIF